MLPSQNILVAFLVYKQDQKLYFVVISTYLVVTCLYKQPKILYFLALKTNATTGAQQLFGFNSKPHNEEYSYNQPCT